MKKYYLGIDPGSPLTFALISPTGKWIARATGDLVGGKIGKYFRNSPEACAYVVKNWQANTHYPLHAVIESIGPRQGEGVVTASEFVASMKISQMMCVCYGIPYTLVSPQKWKKSLSLDSDKEKSRMLARQLWPDKAEVLKFKKAHNLAEAALLGYYGLKETL